MTQTHEQNLEYVEESKIQHGDAKDKNMTIGSRNTSTLHIIVPLSHQRHNMRFPRQTPIPSKAQTFIRLFWIYDTKRVHIQNISNQMPPQMQYMQSTRSNR